MLDVTFENGQARVRTLELMDLANRTGGLVVGTGDLSELALGWATYNGDHMSMYGVNAGVPKTLVRHIVRYEADTAQQPRPARRAARHSRHARQPGAASRDGERRDRAADGVSCRSLRAARLLPLLCAALRLLARKNLPSGEGRVCRAGTPTETLLHWLRNFYRRFFIQQFKRSCLPDGPKVGSVTLSPARRLAHAERCLRRSVWQAELEKLH